MQGWFGNEQERPACLSYTYLHTLLALATTVTDLALKTQKELKGVHGVGVHRRSYLKQIPQARPKKSIYDRFDYFGLKEKPPEVQELPDDLS